MFHCLLNQRHVSLACSASPSVVVLVHVSSPLTLASTFLTIQRINKLEDRGQLISLSDTCCYVKPLYTGYPLIQLDDPSLYELLVINSVVLLGSHSIKGFSLWFSAQNQRHFQKSMKFSINGFYHLRFCSVRCLGRNLWPPQLLFPNPA